VRVRTDFFRELGDGAALTAARNEMDTGLVTLGARAAAAVHISHDDVIQLQAMVGWRHAFGDVTPVSTVAFTGGGPFSIQGAPIQRDALALEAGAEARLSAAVHAGAMYSGLIGDRARDNGFKAYISWRF